MSDVCKIVFKKENNDLLKKSIVNALHRENSNLRKQIESLNCDSNVGKTTINE